MKFTLSLSEKVGIFFIVAAAFPYLIGIVLTIQTYNTVIKAVRSEAEIIIPGHNLIFDARIVALNLRIWSTDSQVFLRNNNFDEFNKAKDKILQGKNQLAALTEQHETLLVPFLERNKELVTTDGILLLEKEKEFLGKLKSSIALYEKHYLNFESPETIKALDSIDITSRELADITNTLAQAVYSQFVDYSYTFYFVIFILWFTVLIGIGSS